MLDLIIKNIGVLATANGQTPLKGSEMGNVTLTPGCAIGIENGVISYIGTPKDAPLAKEHLDAGKNLVTPGLVDAHTHLIFGGWRQHEFELKLSGAAYLDILKAGGGILSTLTKTRETTEDELLDKAKKLSRQMAEYGTTTIEAKSGYGLNLDDELKQLRVVKRLNDETPLDFISTFMGAHAVPPEFKGRADDYINYVCEEVLPVVAKENLAEFCDIFCENGVFDAELSEKLLLKAREFGFLLKIHADEIDPVGGGELAGKIAVHSAEHLIAATDEGIALMANSSVIGCLLPATSFYLDKPYARARYMMQQGMALAVGSDFNPGSSPSFNLQFALNLACLKYKMTPKEALCAVTLNAAAAIGRAATIGTIEIGKKADIVVWDAPDLDYLCYRYGNNQALYTIKNGGIL